MSISDVSNEQLLEMAVSEITDRFSLQEISNRLKEIDSQTHLHRLLVRAQRDWTERATLTIAELIGRPVESLQAELEDEVSENRKHCLRMAIAGIQSQMQAA